ncbi:MAG: hypothetical protein DHS20C01_10570 [marine bacterium B5-7]|nr:MAG: hypothetical protein DHS20C01_10570 [marine bacterium B5-7]
MDLDRFGLYRLLVSQDKTTCMRVVFAAVVAGLLQGAMIIVINAAASAMGRDDLNLRYLLMFLLLLGGTVWPVIFPRHVPSLCLNAPCLLHTWM